MTNASRNDSSNSTPFGPAAFDLNQFFDSMERARRHWGAFVTPAAVGATLDPAELDKRIADLRTVEQWLALNLSLVQGSVKALEMQRATLDAMRAFGQSTQPPQAKPDPVAAAANQAQDWWQSLQAQFRQVADAAINAGRGPSADAQNPESPPKPTRKKTTTRAPRAR